MKKFTINPDGLYYGEKFVSEFCPKLNSIQIYFNLLGEPIRKMYSISIVFPDGRTLASHTFFSIENIDYFGFWPECADASLSPSARRLLRLYLQTQASDMPIEEYCVLDKLGLYDWGFLFGKNNFIPFHEKNSLSIIPSNEIPDFFCPKADKTALMEYALKLLALNPGVTDVLFSVSLLSVLKPLLSSAGYPPNFFLSIYGKSGSMKTTLCDLFFVQFPAQKLSFISSTRREVEEALNTYLGHAIVIDDYHPASSTYDKQKLSSRLDIVARSSDNPDSAFAVINGEFLDGCFSVQDRMIQLFISSPVKDLKTLCFLQENSSMFSSLLLEFAKTIYSQRDAVMETIQTWFQNMYPEPSKQAAWNYRIQRNIHFLALSVELFDTYFLQDKNLLKQSEIFLADTLVQLKNQQMVRMQRLRSLEEGVDWIEEFYNMLRSGIIKIYSDFPKNLDNTLHCVKKDDLLYIRSPLLKRALKEYWGKAVDPAALINAMVEEQILYEDKTPAHVVKRDGIYYYAVYYSRLRLYYHQIREQ